MVTLNEVSLDEVAPLRMHTSMSLEFSWSETTPSKGGDSSPIITERNVTTNNLKYLSPTL